MHALDDDQDYYSFVIEEPGVVEFSFRHEWNNSCKTSDVIDLDLGLSGSLRYRDDVDIYRFELSEKIAVSIRFEHEWIDDGDLYFREHLNPKPNNSKRLVSMDMPGKDTAIELELNLTLESGVYYWSLTTPITIRSCQKP